MKRTVLAALAALLLLCLCGCGKSGALSGTYRALDPPRESGEMVTESLEFDGDTVTMISGETRQSVKYAMKDGKFTIKTRFGDFSYACELRENGDLLIDGVTYRK